MDFSGKRERHWGSDPHRIPADLLNTSLIASMPRLLLDVSDISGQLLYVCSRHQSRMDLENIGHAHSLLTRSCNHGGGMRGED
jgi:hypothetical protein